MRFYYTTPVEQDAPQLRPDLSLGGFKSLNVIPNASLHNLFSDVSVYSILSKKDEYIAVILKNETGGAIDSVRLWFVYPNNCQVIYSVGAVALNNGQMEHLTTPYQAPYYADFFEANGETNAVDLGSLDIDGMIGVWFKRTVDESAIESQYSDANLATNGNPIEGDEDIQIKVDWVVGDIEVTGTSTNLTAYNGSVAITLDTPITALADTDITVKRNGTDLVWGVDYIIASVTESSFSVLFNSSATLINTDVILAIVVKSGYVINGGLGINIPNLMPVSITSTVMSGLTSSTGTANITFMPSIVGLVAGDITVYKDGVPLTIEYSFRELTMNGITILFDVSAGLTSSSVVTVLVEKEGYLVDFGVPTLIPNSIH